MFESVDARTHARTDARTPARVQSYKLRWANDQELIESDPTSYPQYINWRQFTKGTRGKPNEQLFPK